MAPPNCLSDQTIQELRSLRRNEALDVLEQLDRLEKKYFPLYEAFQFNPKLLKQQNATVFFLIDAARGSSRHSIQAYAVCVRFRGAMLLHKICVAEALRNQGIGKYLMNQILLRARSMSCRCIELWVDESRAAARHLYRSCGFSDTQKLSNYYSAGRHAIKMVLSLEP